MQKNKLAPNKGKASVAWRPGVSEAPKDGRLIILLDGDGDRHIAFWEQAWSWKKFRVVRQFSSVWCEADTEEKRSFNISAWAPLPTADEFNGARPTPPTKQGTE